MARRGQKPLNPEREGATKAHRIKAPDAELDAIRDYARRKNRAISHVTRDLWREAIARDDPPCYARLTSRLEVPIVGFSDAPGCPEYVHPDKWVYPFMATLTWYQVRA